MSESAAALPASSENEKTPSKPTLAWPPSAQTMRMVGEALQVGLALLEGSKKTRPYAAALRAATSIGIAAVPAEKEKIIERIGEARSRMKELETQGLTSKEAKKQHRAQQEQIFVLLDLLLQAR